MKKSCLLGIAMVASCLALPAHGTLVQGFTGPYAPGTWATTSTGNVLGASTSATSTSVTLRGADAASPDPVLSTPACTGATYEIAGPCQVNFVTATILTPFVFDWSYSTADLGGPGGDVFGMLVDGVRVVLSDLGGARTQGGHVSIGTPTTSFGWFINCTDCIGGAATATITNFAAGSSVPEPGTMALLGFGVIAAGAARRTRKFRPVERIAAPPTC